MMVNVTIYSIHGSYGKTHHPGPWAIHILLDKLTANLSTWMTSPVLDGYSLEKIFGLLNHICVGYGKSILHSKILHLSKFNNPCLKITSVVDFH